MCETTTPLLAMTAIYTRRDARNQPYLPAQNPERYAEDSPYGIIVSASLSISLMVPQVNPSFKSTMKVSSRHYSEVDLGFRKNTVTHIIGARPPRNNEFQKLLNQLASETPKGPSRLYAVLDQPSPGMSHFCNMHRCKIVFTKIG